LGKEGLVRRGACHGVALPSPSPSSPSPRGAGVPGIPRDDMQLEGLLDPIQDVLAPGLVAGPPVEMKLLHGVGVRRGAAREGQSGLGQGCLDLDTGCQGQVRVDPHDDPEPEPSHPNPLPSPNPNPNPNWIGQAVESTRSRVDQGGIKAGSRRDQRAWSPCRVISREKALPLA
jgi:hypothetical protein